DRRCGSPRGNADPAAPAGGPAGRRRLSSSRRRPARGCARPRCRDGGARALARGRRGLCSPGPLLPQRAAASRGARGARPPLHRPGVLMAIVTDTLEPIREKVVAAERLDLEDGLVLFESADLLGLGELADTARRVRGGDDRVFFVQNLYLNQTNVCRVKCKFCAFAVTQKQGGAYTHSGDELARDALRQREITGFTEI